MFCVQLLPRRKLRQQTPVQQSLLLACVTVTVDAFLSE